MFKRKFFASWGDMDFNAHMRNTAYLDKSADLRMIYFSENDFPMSEFIKLKIGPVIMKDEIEYIREVQLLEEVWSELALAGLSEDGSRMSLRNIFRRSDEKIVAVVTSIGGWLDLTNRKLLAPPTMLLNILNKMDRSSDFKLLPSSLKES